MTDLVSKSVDLKVSPLGRVEGDLDLRCTVSDGVVTEAWTEAAMFRGFEIILRGKDPQAGLIMTPRICGICGGSHLTKSAYALDTAWKTHLPPNAILVRNIAQACETLQSVPRWFYALFAIDTVHKKYAKADGYAEAVRRWAPFVGEHYEHGVTIGALPVEIYAIFGGQWPHSSFMCPGGVMCAPTLSDMTRATAILERFTDEWVEGKLFGGSVERWLENKTWDDVLAWMHENPGHYNSDVGFFIRYGQEIGLQTYGAGPGNFLAAGTFFEPSLYGNPTIEGRNDALITRSGVYANGDWHAFDQANVREDHTNSFFRGSGELHPFEGVTDPIDPLEGRKQGKYTWAKAPRYHIPGVGSLPLEVGPLARQIIAGNPDRLAHQDYDPLIHNCMQALGGPSIFLRVLARLHEEAKYVQLVRSWIRAVDLKEDFYAKPVEHESGKGFGATEAARGFLADWIVLENGKIANYQVITPTAWNIGPQDGSGTHGPMEQAFIGTPVADAHDPVELGHVARSFDSCLVCTVHAYDAKGGAELSKFVVNGLV